jgi:rhodanese-related sulfurtransferase
LESGLLGSKVLGTDGPFPVWFGWRELLIGSDGFVVDSPEAAELLTEGLVSTGEPAPERFIMPGPHLTQHLSPVTYRQQEASNLDLSQIENHVLIDLRHRGEWLLGHLRGSRNLPFEEFSELPEEFSDTDVAVYCGSGYRASMFLALAKKSNQDRVSINGSMLKTFGEGEYWCSIPHNGAHCDT